MEALIVLGVAGGCVLLGAAGTLTTYREHRRYVTRTYFFSLLSPQEGDGRHRRMQETFMNGTQQQPDVFEIKRPYMLGNSGSGFEDPEYAAMKSGEELEHAERGYGARASHDFVWLKRYFSPRCRARRVALLAWLGDEYTVLSYRDEGAARAAYELAHKRMMERSL